MQNYHKTKKNIPEKLAPPGPIPAVYCMRLSHAITCALSQLFQMFYIFAQIFKILPFSETLHPCLYFLDWVLTIPIVTTKKKSKIHPAIFFFFSLAGNHRIFYQDTTHHRLVIANFDCILAGQNLRIYVKLCLPLVHTYMPTKGSLKLKGCKLILTTVQYIDIYR